MADEVATPTTRHRPGFVALAAGEVVAVGEGVPAGADDELVVSLGARLVAPGFVDVHVHGGGGAEVNAGSVDATEAAVRAMAALHAAHGTTSLVATTVTDSLEHLGAALQGIARVVRSPDGRGADVLGSHLEGPWLSPLRAGAQDPDDLRSPRRDQLERLVEAADGTLRLVTIAPELPGADELLAAVLDAGARGSVGHSDATYEQARAAFDAGASHATHLFNAMAPLHHRRPGAALAALLDDTVTVELICDGHHLHPAFCQLVAEVAPERVVLVSDAVCAAGSPDGRYLLGGRAVIVEAGRVSLDSSPGTLAGSVLTMERAVENYARASGCATASALAAASLTAARAVGAARKGRLAPGADGDLVVLDQSGNVEATLVRGRPVFDPGGLFAGL